jgi:Fuc2NAc and GlcNAc transferase
MTGPAAWGYPGVIVVAFLVSFLLTGLAAWYARRRGLLDHPGERHSHTQVTPRGGGAGLVLAFVLVPLLVFPGGYPEWWLYAILPGVVVLALTGWWDDHVSLSVRYRLMVQLAVTGWLMGYAVYAGWHPGLSLMFACGLFVIWMVNLYNFMDGSNGMAGLQGVFAAAVLAGLFHAANDSSFTLLSLVLAACCAGFLPWNLGQARVFMGDVGSLALGFAFASMLLYGVASKAFSYPVAWLVMLLFITDASLTLLWRVIRGERWYNAHRQHLYQRMIAHGLTHGRVATVYQAVNMIMVLPGIVLAVRFPTLAWVIALVLTLTFVLGWHYLLRHYKEPATAG